MLLNCAAAYLLGMASTSFACSTHAKDACLGLLAAACVVGSTAVVLSTYHSQQRPQSPAC